MLNNKRYSISDYVSAKFYQLPKWLFMGKYKDLSSNERIIYSLLCSRFSISVKNEWIDENECIFFYYKQKELAESSCLSKRTVQRSIQALKEAGLIDEERVGANSPNRMYLLKPEYEELISEDSEYETDGGETENDNEETEDDNQDSLPEKDEDTQALTEEITDKNIINLSGQTDASEKENAENACEKIDKSDKLSYQGRQIDASVVTNCRSPNDLKLMELINTINQYQYHNQYINPHFKNCGNENYNTIIQELKEKIKYDRFKGKILEETIVNEILDIIVSNIYLGQDCKYNVGSIKNQNYISAEVIKSVFNNQLDYSIMASYVHQFLCNARSVSNPINYHIKGLYVQCVTRNSRMISRMKQEAEE